MKTLEFVKKNRSLLEDIFLYVLLVVVIGFSSWFLIRTQLNLEKEVDILQKSIISKELLEHEKVDKDYLVYLQAHAVLNEKRYQLGNNILKVGVTRKNTGFLIGMLLALIGCIVIVRRIRSMSVSLKGEITNQKFEILTASPGVLLVVLGSLLILATIIRTDSVKVSNFDPSTPASVTKSTSGSTTTIEVDSKKSQLDDHKDADKTLKDRLESEQQPKSGGAK